MKYKVANYNDKYLDVSGNLFFDLSYIAGSITGVPSNVIPTLSYNIKADSNFEYSLAKFKVKQINKKNKNKKLMNEKKL